MGQFRAPILSIYLPNIAGFLQNSSLQHRGKTTYGPTLTPLGPTPYFSYSKCLCLYPFYDYNTHNIYCIKNITLRNCKQFQVYALEEEFTLQNDHLSFERRLKVV